MDLLKRVLWAVVLCACVPDVDLDESVLGAPRLLAVRAEPAEAAPGQTVRLTALYAGADGALEEAPLEWAFCVARPPLAELGPVSRACLDAENDEALWRLGRGVTVEGDIPADACRTFGPEPPPALPGEPAGRPTDPDVTGGYGQPVRVADDARTSFVEVRLACGLFGATQQQAAEHRRRYRRNTAPSIEALELVRADGRPIALGDEPASVTAGEEVALRVRWPSCPLEDACGDGVCGVDESAAACAGDCTSPSGCGGQERFLRFDLASRALVVEREALRVAWYASAEGLALERTGVAPEEVATESENTFIAPSTPGLVHVVVVLRDARGGVTWRSARLSVVAEGG
jgi:hypothetical protein